MNIEEFKVWMAGIICSTVVGVVTVVAIAFVEFYRPRVFCEKCGKEVFIQKGEEQSSNRKNPSPEKVKEYMDTHNGEAPPASWYPNGDPWRNLTAEEVNKMFGEDE